MRNALSEALDGAIGHIGPGYRAPQAKVNIDEQAELAFEANARHIAAPMRWKRSTRRPPIATTMDILRHRVLAIVAEHGPLDESEVVIRMGRKFTGNARFTKARIVRTLDMLRAAGEVRVSLLCGRHGEGRRAVFEVPR